MAVLVLQIFSPTVVKSKCLYALSEMSWFYDLETHETFGFLYRILRDNKTELFTSPFNWDNWDPCSHTVVLWNFAALKSHLCCRCWVVLTFQHTGLFHSPVLHLFLDLKYKGTRVDSVHLVVELSLRTCVCLRVCGNDWFINLYLLGHCPLWIAAFNSVISLIIHAL